MRMISFQCWQWEIGCLVIVMAWLNLLGEIRTLPFLGIYIIMFLDIFRTMIKFSVVFLIFIVAFSLGFHMLLLTREVLTVLHTRSRSSHQFEEQSGY